MASTQTKQELFSKKAEEGEVDALLPKWGVIY
jgi:hypothetical protein